MPFISLYRTQLVQPSEKRRLACLQRLLGGLCGGAIRRALSVSLPLKSGAAAAPQGGARGGGVGHPEPTPSPEGVPSHCHCCWLGGTGLPPCHLAFAVTVCKWRPHFGCIGAEMRCCVDAAQAVLSFACITSCCCASLSDGSSERLPTREALF